MSRKQRLVFLALSLAALLVVGRIVLGNVDFVFKDFWFSSGLLLLILLTVFDQPHFSSESAVFLNGVAGLTALPSVPPSDRDAFWVLFFVWSWYLVASSYWLMLRRSTPLSSESSAVQFVSRLNRKLGRPEALFSGFFLWGIYSQFGPNHRAFAALMWYWAIFLILDFSGLAKAIADSFGNMAKPTRPTAGSLTSFISPRLAEAELTSDAPAIAAGREVQITGDDGESWATATVIDDRILSGVRRIRLGITTTTEHWKQLPYQPTNRAKIVFVEKQSSDVLVSAVDKSSDIGVLKVHVDPAVDLTDGEILWVQLPNGSRAHYQIVAATIAEDSLGGDQGLHQVIVSASQLGTWVEQTSTFDPITWVAPAGGLVYKAQSGDVERELPQGCKRVGTVPKSNFPVHVFLQDIVTHNTAILGVTGSGKSFLAAHLVETLVESGIRVLVLDITCQYWSMLVAKNPTAIRNLAELQAWLAGETRLGIYQFADSENFTRTTADFVDACFTYLKSTINLQPGTNEPARLCVVFEEAHSLIPEWNQVAAQSDTQNVNRTARTVLQGRKYGMGCIVVSQRTANVTKTILNQCNTIAAFQCFDQTGLDFLKNYLGEEQANAISNLPLRHAVIVGKASSSRRPIRVLIDDLSDHWQPPQPQVQAAPL